MNKSTTILLLFLLLNFSCLAKVKNKGIPFIKNFPRGEYHGGTQNWDIAQSSKGLMYFANNEGVLEFDGTNWRLIEMPNNSVVRSLVIDGSDKVFVGAYNEFGFLEPDEKGKLTFRSLVNLVTEKDRDFKEIWQIYLYKNGIVFHSFQKVFFYKDGKISVFGDGELFRQSFVIGDEFYVQVPKKGFCKLNGQNFQLVDEGEKLKNYEIVSVLPYSEDELLIATALNGLFIYNSGKIEAWNLKVNKSFIKEQIYSGLAVNKKYFVFGTVRNGLYIINKQGQIIQHINTDLGLLNNTILSLFQDSEENLWLGLDNGINHLEISSPVSTFPRIRDIGTGYASIYHNGYLYLGTNMGLFAQKYDFSDATLNTEEKFNLVENTAGQVWSLEVIGGELICGHTNGTFRIDKNRGELISDVEGGWKYLYHKDFPNKMIGGTYSGLILFERESEKDKWKFKQKIGGFNESSRELLWGADNSIWMSHGYKGIYRIVLNNALDSCINVRLYGTEDGLPSDLSIGLHEVRGEKVFTTNNGIYKYVPELNKFEIYSSLNNLFGTKKELTKLFQQSNGDVWYFQDGRVGILKLQVDNTYAKQELAFSSIRGSFIGAFENVCEIDRQNILIATEDGFVHYNPEIRKMYENKFHTLIREVRIAGKTQDSVIYAGSKSNNENSVEYIKFKNNEIRFQFSAPQSSHAQLVNYKYQLQGFDQDTSAWEVSTNKEYTNLREGEYVFRVLAQNQYGVQSVPDEFKFVILPPWYRSKLAYFVYVFTSLLIIYGLILLVRLRMKQIQYRLEKQQEEELKAKEQKFREEALIAEREIVELRNEKLKSEVDFKTRELASSTMNIIHKNEVLSYAVGELKKALKKIKDPTALVQVRQLMKTLDSEFNSDQDWEQFELHFDQVHENFIKRLRSSFPQLTPKDLRMCAYLRMNLSTKEIAPLMNISVRGVEISRYRLRKKFDLNREENLIDFLLNV
ncbi:triple tyrosine motif-containing protein [Marinifilum fragile]|uniref:triple tyrosine motif-containing protein n=1 Tax=Marinifilum fragile TaxID=570161 RepID=UPI002AA684DA|nr:triple tyrosine motif-containing protein [Marinifilum fragile]